LARNSPKNISFFAPAKINLYLHITTKRRDGYHSLESLVAFANYGDEISVAPSDKLTLTINGPYSKVLRSKGDNIVIKAAKLLASSHGVDQKAKITLTKNLPISSGIGGGSADAAATLYALSKLWDLSLKASDFSNLAEKLGADVSVCLKNTPSIVTGIGEKVILAPELPNLWFILVNPGVPVSTRKVFAAYKEKNLVAQAFKTSPKTAKELAILLSKFRNDLTPAAIATAPIIEEVLDAVQAEKNQLLTRLSGSGATCFALFEEKNAAIEAARGLKMKYPKWWVKAAALYSQ